LIDNNYMAIKESGERISSPSWIRMKPHVTSVLCNHETQC